ncbi:putative glucose-6-phosphate 1-epimerase [Janthinobacterium sp. HH103]|uniref:D-hexose-6-phosphate mutarotase n=1 Tax=unclassified Janthinobacterium TaxID=2610881 RepID=UPI0008738B8B|nr:MULTISPECIES: D-hexose-6-phosphate mutarotase [unclassified Janthinobacterium]OEZ67769.1 putative glucose-6-phosphate 1-epimerase [Janthinobacterium sp. HH100]OEZ67814.1 putative glucose-6-phosphate 1-epimerase [Janthinobacterium sp. HH100]OEZ70819.1 putative glucose-6-phosphate 1-epimerase [Janthinobacterium sp. HH103]QOU75593.1 Putative glucose-6-phosphate 1-epimerase [Janthinobacterium sp. HH102]
MSNSTFGQLPAVTIRAADGAQATVTLYGGHLVSWQTSDGQERLFCSRDSALDGSRAIRGGVPVIFPQFGARGTGMRHGFARVATWQLESTGDADGTAWAQFILQHTVLPEAIAASWPWAFTLRLRVAVQGQSLELHLSVHNTGEQAFPFSAALHSYFAIDRLSEARVGGLQRVRYSDETPQDALQAEEELQFSDKLDRIYYQLPGALTLQSGGHTLRLEQQGFTDAVVWNPGAQDAAALPDLGDDEYQRFICIEPALIQPDLLAAGAEWTGRQRLEFM